MKGKEVQKTTKKTKVLVGIVLPCVIVLGTALYVWLTGMDIHSPDTKLTLGLSFVAAYIPFSMAFIPPTL